MWLATLPGPPLVAQPSVRWPGRPPSRRRRVFAAPRCSSAPLRTWLRSASARASSRIFSASVSASAAQPGDIPIESHHQVGHARGHLFVAVGRGASDRKRFIPLLVRRREPGSKVVDLGLKGLHAIGDLRQVLQDLIGVVPALDGLELRFSDALGAWSRERDSVGRYPSAVAPRLSGELLRWVGAYLPVPSTRYGPKGGEPTSRGRVPPPKSRERNQVSGRPVQGRALPFVVRSASGCPRCRGGNPPCPLATQEGGGMPCSL